MRTPAVSGIVRRSRIAMRRRGRVAHQHHHEERVVWCAVVAGVSRTAQFFALLLDLLFLFVGHGVLMVFVSVWLKLYRSVRKRREGQSRSSP